MTRMFKTLGVALVAVFAMSAVVATAAMAQESHTFKHDSQNGRAILTGTTEPGTKELFRNTPGATPVECHGTFRATAAENEVDVLTVKPTYSECEWEGSAASVNTNGCLYKFGSDTDANGHAKVHILCENPGEKIELTINGICTLSFGEQTVDQGVHYENKGGGAEKEDVTVNATATGIDFTKSTPGSFCFLVTGGTTGTYNSMATVKAYEDESVSATNEFTPSETVEGAQVNATIVNP